LNGVNMETKEQKTSFHVFIAEVKSAEERTSSLRSDEQKRLLSNLEKAPSYDTLFNGKDSKKGEKAK